MPAPKKSKVTKRKVNPSGKKGKKMKSAAKSAKPGGKIRCRGKSCVTGARCSRATTNGYCWQHGRNIERGWHKKAPRLIGDRRYIADKFGADKCFLDPKNLKYPICPKRTGKPTCQGVAAARARALILHEDRIVKKADDKARRLRCK